ncbi:MAG: lactate utilization protein [Bacillota bacterium]|nr:lactate utilization protein [Bacillota bacterium]
MDFQQWHHDVVGEKVVNALKKNHFDAVYFSNKEEAAEHVLGFISPGNTVGIGGSATITELKLIEKAVEKGAEILNHNAPGLSPAEVMDIRRKQLLSDVFLCSSNAITRDGVLVNIDGVGNRVSAITFGPKKVAIVVGTNKICKDVHSALERIRAIASPINNKRLGTANPCVKTGYCSDCQGETRICNAYSIIKKRPRLTDITVVVVGESLGF